MNEHEKVSAIIGDLSPLAATTDVEVEVRFGDMMQNFCKEMHAALSYQVTGRGVELPFSVEDLEAFVEIAIEARVKYVRGERLVVKAGDFGWKIPCFVHFVLSQIGIVEVKEAQLRLIPKFGSLTRFVRQEMGQKTIEPQSSYDKRMAEFIRKMSSWLEQLAPKAVATALPKHTDGEKDFMSLTVIEGLVKGPNTVAQPVMTLATAFVESTRLTNMMTAHVTYAPTVYYEQFVPQLARVGTEYARSVSS